MQNMAMRLETHKYPASVAFDGSLYTLVLRDKPTMRLESKDAVELINAAIDMLAEWASECRADNKDMPPPSAKQDGDFMIPCIKPMGFVRLS